MLDDGELVSVSDAEVEIYPYTPTYTFLHLSSVVYGPPHHA